MNKRQKKKRNTIISNRIAFFNRVHTRFMFSGRMNGKSLFYNTIIKACWNKRYKPFKLLKKEYDKKLVSIDYSNGKDYTAKTTYKMQDGTIKILSTEIIQ